jgi:glycosyltransferase involved in cell wall biosynthesis
MKNVLIISFYFHQMQAIASVRVRGIVKYLPEFGWNPVVLTVKTSPKPDNNGSVFETPYVDTHEVWKKQIGIPLNKSVKEVCHITTNSKKKTIIEKITELWAEFFIYPDPTINWSRSAIEKGNQILDHHHFDAIISSMSPNTSHIIAKELVKRKSIPWIADFRDLWTQNSYYPYSGIRKFFETKLERTTIVSANVLTTVSLPLAEKLQKLHTHKKVYTITNGYDPEQLNPGIPLTKKFSITFTGAIYKDRQDPEPLFRILRVLIDEKRIDPAKIEVNFFGNHDAWLLSDIKKHGMEKITQLHGLVSREESIEKQREAQVLLLLTWNDPQEKGVYTGKLFDYLAAKRPILALGLKGSVITELLGQTQAGVNVSSDAEIKDQIVTFYQEYEETGLVRYYGISSEIEKYSHREMAKKFADILEEISESV